MEKKCKRGRPKNLGSLGKHLIVELYGCNRGKLKKANVVEKIMLAAAHEAKTTIVSHEFHNFNPFGVSGMVIIAESHLSIHTWPEYAYAAVDIFTCGNTIKPKVAADFLVKAFGAKKATIKRLQRGIFSVAKGETLRHKVEM